MWFPPDRAATTFGAGAMPHQFRPGVIVPKKEAAWAALKQYRIALGGQGVPMTSDAEDLIFNLLESFDPVVADATLSNVIDARERAGRPVPYTRPESLEG